MMAATVSSNPALDRTLASVDALQARVGALQEQVSTGKRFQSYAGLAELSSRVLDLTATRSRAVAHDGAIAAAQGKASAIQDVLGQIGTIVTGVSTAALGLVGTSPSSTVTSVAEQARRAFAQVASLLNTQWEGQYVFAGEDTGNPPVPGATDATGSGFYTQVGAAVASLAGGAPVSGVIADTVAVAGSTAAGTTLFSAYLNGGTALPGAVQVSDTQSVSLGVTANRNGSGILSDPAIAGTGSAMSDILRGLAVLANSTTATATSADFPALVRDATGTLSSAGRTLNEMEGAVGQVQATLTAAAGASTSFQLLLTKQLGRLTDVDPAAAISELQSVASQLQVSYKVLSLASGLHLASYL